MGTKQQKRKQRDALISLRLTSDERERWHREASKRGLTLSDYLRELVQESAA